MGVYRADRSTYVVFAVILLLPLGWPFIYAAYHPTLDNLFGSAMLAAGLGFVYCWIRAFRISIDSERLTYKSFTQRRAVALKQIRKVDFTMEPLGGGGTEPT